MTSGSATGTGNALSATATGSASGAGSATATGSAGDGSATGSGSGAETASGSASGSASETGSAAGSAATTLPVRATLAKLSIDSDPTGASVYLGGKLAGTAPLKIEVPTSTTPIAIELRLAGYRKKVQDLVITGNTAARIELERAPTTQPPHGTGKGTGKGSGGKAGGDGLLRPDDL
jgi:hypothetical protein